MTRTNKLAHKRNLSNEDSYKLGESVVDLKAVMPINGIEQTGTVVYRRKAEYKDSTHQMARSINTAHKRNLPDEDLYKIGEPVVRRQAVVPINGKEQTGSVVYRRKAEYRDLPFN